MIKSKTKFKFNEGDKAKDKLGSIARSKSNFNSNSKSITKNNVQQLKLNELPFDKVKSIFIAHPNYIEDLKNEINRRNDKTYYSNFSIDNFIFTNTKYTNYLNYQDELTCKPIWAQAVWTDVSVVEFKSIKDAASILRKLKRDWISHSFQFHRRTQLIKAELPKYSFSESPLEFSQAIENLRYPKMQNPENGRINFGVFCLIDQYKLLVCENNSLFDQFKLVSERQNSEIHIPQTTVKKTLNLLPEVIRNPIVIQSCGEIDFKEDKTNPPSRAYLKLWEFFTVYKIVPQKNDICIELGAAPGGWTWVLVELGCEVYSFDRAPLEAKLIDNKKYKNKIHHSTKDAFMVKPKDLPNKVKWLFSDLICDPNKLYDYILENWSDENYNMVCTLKFKGETDFAIIEKFKNIKTKLPAHFKNHQVFLTHLYNNKHEITFCLFEDKFNRK